MKERASLLRPCVPVLAPRGAAAWSVAPLWHSGLSSSDGGKPPHRSVGLALSSPYWQYQTVRRSNGIRLSLRSVPLGFSMIQNLGCHSQIQATVFFTSAIRLRAFSVFGT